MAAIEQQEALGGEAQNGATGQPDKGGEGGLVGGTEGEIGGPLVPSIGGAEALGQVDLIAIPRRQIGLDAGELFAVLGPAHVALPLALQGEGGAGLRGLRRQPLQASGEPGFISPVHQLPATGCDVSQQCPVVDPHRHVGYLDVRTGLDGQTLEAPAQIVAKEPQGAPDEGQVMLILHQFAQQGSLGLGEQGEGIAVMMALVASPGEAGAGTPGLQGGERIGADDVKAVVGARWACRFQQDGPGLVLQAGKQGVKRCLRIEMVDMQSWFHFLLHRQQFAPSSLAGSGAQAYHGRRHF